MNLDQILSRTVKLAEHWANETDLFGRRRTPTYAEGPSLPTVYVEPTHVAPRAQDHLKLLVGAGALLLLLAVVGASKARRR